MSSNLGVWITYFIIFKFVIATSAYELQVLSIRAPFKINTMVLKVKKDGATGFHVSKIQKRTPHMSLPFLVDLNGKFLQVNCENNYSSSTYNVPFCHSTLCARATMHYCHICTSQSKPGCHNNTCAIMVRNPLTQKSAIVELAQDVLSISTMNQALTLGQLVTIPKFLFACSPSSLFQGPLPKNIEGIVGLGYSSVSLPNQLASYFGVSPKFALCLTSSPSNNGVMLFGNSIYATQPRGRVFQSPIFTPIFINSQGEYFIQVRAMRINNHPISITSILPRSRTVDGVGAILSTTIPYTILEHSLYQIFTRIFTDAMPKITQVSPVAPFRLCFHTRNFTSSLRNVPNVDFIMQNQNVKWTIGGANSMVQAQPGVSCLAFVDGGLNPRAPIIIGLHQMEDNLLEFDLARSRLGFSQRRFFYSKTCADFNFTSFLYP